MTSQWGRGVDKTRCFNSSKSRLVPGSMQKKPPHFREADFCPESPTEISSPSQKAFVFCICPTPPTVTIPTYLSKSSSYLFSSFCHHTYSSCCLPSSPVPLPFPAVPSWPLRLVFMLVKGHMTSGILHRDTGADQIPVKSHYLLPEEWHS